VGKKTEAEQKEKKNKKQKNKTYSFMIYSKKHGFSHVFLDNLQQVLHKQTMVTVWQFASMPLWGARWSSAIFFFFFFFSSQKKKAQKSPKLDTKNKTQTKTQTKTKKKKHRRDAEPRRVPSGPRRDGVSLEQDDVAAGVEAVEQREVVRARGADDAAADDDAPRARGERGFRGLRGEPSPKNPEHCPNVL
jgi:hypothetical protein